MKIGIAARGLDGQGGPKQYIESLLSALTKVNEKHELYYFYNSLDFIGKYPEANEIVLESSSKLFWDYYLIPKAVKDYGIDVILFPKNVLPFFINCKSIIVIHDLAYYMPELNAYPFIDTTYMKSMIKSSVKRANHIIAISENTKRDIIKFTSVEEDKITVVYEASDRKYIQIFDKTELDVIKKKHNLPEQFIFCCDSITPRKNTIQLLVAFDIIKDKIPHMLVLTGGVSWKSKKVIDLVDSMKDNVIKLGYVPDEDMPLLYNLADIFVYPSLYEGFGLPPLEAMACGCPVITSNTSSIPEVVGDAGVMVDPYSIADLAKAMYEVLTDDKLRENMIKKGLERAKKFSWETCANDTLDVLEEIMRR